MSSAPTPGIVFVVDDDDSMRRALSRRLRVAGFDARDYASATEFLAHVRDVDGVACIVTDMRMPGMSGLELQASLADAGRDLPLVFISGHGDVPTSVQAMRAGAVHFLVKPFSDADILAAVSEALDRSARQVEDRRARSAVDRAYAMLTPREREVFALVAQGHLNKVIADRLGAAEKTIKIHRARVMHKMGAKSAADLVRMASLLGT